MAETRAGPWSGFGTSDLDQALALEEGPIAWLPGGFTVTEDEVWLAIRGERAAVASWSRSQDGAVERSVAIRWISDAPTR